MKQSNQLFLALVSGTLLLSACQKGTTPQQGAQEPGQAQRETAELPEQMRERTGRIADQLRQTARNLQQQAEQLAKRADWLPGDQSKGAQQGAKDDGGMQEFARQLRDLSQNMKQEAQQLLERADQLATGDEAQQRQSAKKSGDDAPGGLFAPEQATGPLAISSLSSTVRPGGQILLTVKAAPNTPISVETDGATVKGPNFIMQKFTDKQGMVTWEWTLDENYKADKVPVIVTADYQQVDKKLVEELKVEGAHQPTLKAELVQLSTTHRPGEQVTVQIKTEPNASVDIQAHGVSTTNPNLTANEQGLASWTFDIGKSYEGNKVPLIITIKKDDRERKLIEEINISGVASGGGQPAM